jgi:hypothetical protein
MGYLRKLIERYPGGHGQVNGQGVNIYTDDQTYMLVYTPDGEAVKVDFIGTDSKWFDPRTGWSYPTDSHTPPPTSEDWVLIIEK